MFCAEAANASFVASANSTGRTNAQIRFDRHCDRRIRNAVCELRQRISLYTGAAIIRSTIFFRDRSVPPLRWSGSRPGPEISHRTPVKIGCFFRIVSVFAAL